MLKLEKEKLDALIFVDANIFLDFYRIRNSNVSIKYLKIIEKHINLIITSNQIEMEFKKNRQTAILESINEVKKIGNPNISVPAIISNAKATEMLKKSKRDIERNQKQLKVKIEKILKKPSYNDPVYKTLQKLFKNNSEINLTRENKKRFAIRDLAKERFTLGYPPRKKSDNSIGDAIHWEWIISCAESTGKHIIIVTRDSDFGCSYDNKSFLNDWLQQEFKERISQKRKIVLTDKLSEAFKLVRIPVTEEMINEEEIIIRNLNSDKLQKAIQNMQDNFNNSGLKEQIQKIRQASINFNKMIDNNEI